MSSQAPPVSAERFAEAIQDLPIGNLHMKIAELRNANFHMRSSNEQMQPFAEDGDRDCADAIRENHEIIVRNEERIDMLKREVESRGLPWIDPEGSVVANSGRDETDHPSVISENRTNGTTNEDITREATNTEPSLPRNGRSLQDGQPLRRTSEHLYDDSDGEGMHL